MTWFVVRFDNEDTVEAVPNTWYIKKKSRCYWPPEGTIKGVIIDFIKKKHCPETNWILYEASILGIYDNYKIAQQKANKARDTNNLSSNNEALKDKCKRNRKKIRKRYNKSDSEPALSSETEISSDDVMYPDIPTEQIESSDRMRVENNTDKNNQFRDITNITSDTTTSTSNNTTVKTALVHHKLDSNFEPNISEKAFEKRVLRELHIISLKIDDISEIINALLKDKADKSQKSFVCNNVPDIIQSFPVNHNSLAELENWLMSSNENKTILAQNLSRIGGCTVKEVVRKIMYHIFTNEVSMSYSWEGAKKKKVFKNLAVAPIILSTVRLNKKTQECTDSEIIYFIKAWLVRCKDRFNNKNKDKNIAPEEVETTEN